VTPAERFKAQLRRGYPPALAIRETVMTHGLTIASMASGSNGITEISAVACLWHLYELGDTALIDRVLSIITSAWPQQHGRLEATMMKTIALFLVNHEGEFDEAVVVEAMRGVYPAHLRLRANQMRTEYGTGGPTQNLYRALVTLYNEHAPRKDRLGIKGQSFASRRGWAARKLSRDDELELLRLCRRGGLDRRAGQAVQALARRRPADQGPVGHPAADLPAGGRPADAPHRLPRQLRGARVPRRRLPITTVRAHGGVRPMRPLGDDARANAAILRLYGNDQFAADLRLHTQLLGETLTTSGEVVPQLILHFITEPGAEIDVTIAAIVLDSAARRDHALGEFGAVFAREHPNGICLAAFWGAEAWMASEHLPPNENRDEAIATIARAAGRTPPSERPDRVEVLLVAGTTIDGRSALGMAPIRRERPGDDTSTVTGLGEWKIAAAGDTVVTNLIRPFWAGYLAAPERPTSNGA
jgi:hypothetical protein